MAADPAIHAATVVPLMVSTGGGLDMHVQPAEIVGREGVFRITLLNQMSQPVYVVLAARDHKDGLRFRIEPEDAVIVPAGGVAGTITVHVVPKVRTLIGAPQPYEITFDGLTPWSEDESIPALVQRAHFTYLPRYTARLLPLSLRRAPGWALLLPLVLLLLLLVFAGGRTLANPSMRVAATPMPVPTRVAATPMPVPTRVIPAVHLPRPRAAMKGRALSPSMPSVRRVTPVHRRQGRSYRVVWQTGHGGRPVAGAGARPAPPGASTVRLTAANNVANRHRILRVARAAPTATPTPRPTVTSTPPPTSTPLSTSTPTPPPTATATAPPTSTPMPPPTATSIARPTTTPTPVSVTLGTMSPPIAALMSTPVAAPTPRPTVTPAPVSVTLGTTPPPAGDQSTPTAVPVTCCLAQP